MAHNLYLDLVAEGQYGPHTGLDTQARTHIELDADAAAELASRMRQTAGLWALPRRELADRERELGYGAWGRTKREESA